MQKLILIALCIAVTAASTGVAPYGVITPITRCGGSGTFLELRVLLCDGICELVPGTKYDIEMDLIPSSASSSLSLRLIAQVLGEEVTILHAALPNSSVQPGQLYTIIYALTPNDLLSGTTVMLTSNIYQTANGRLEICIRNEVKIQ